MTDHTLALRALLEKSSDTGSATRGPLREMIGFTAQRLMDLKAKSLTGVPNDQRSDERVNQRKDSATGPVNPAPAPSNCASPSCATAANSRFPGARRLAEKAMTAVMQEAYVQGISTRSVDALVKAMGMEGISKSQVSRLRGKSIVKSPIL